MNLPFFLSLFWARLMPCQVGKHLCILLSARERDRGLHFPQSCSHWVLCHNHGPANKALASQASGTHTVCSHTTCYCLSDLTCEEVGPVSLPNKGKPGCRPEPLGAHYWWWSRAVVDWTACTLLVLWRGTMKRRRKSRKAKNKHNDK